MSFVTATALDGAQAAGGAAACPKLESTHNKWKSERRETGRFFLRPCPCRARTCEKCGPRYGWKTRQRMLQRAGDFNRPALFTLTVDRKQFGSPLDAFLHITLDGYIRRLLRLLGVKRWAWVLEFQMKTGDGWPHWHIVIDLPRGGIDLERAWRLWRDKWHLGGLQLQRKPNSNARHAMMYITKYLTKFPKRGFPSWVLEFKRRIRWVGASKAVGPVVSDRELTQADRPNDEDEQKSLPPKHRPLIVRMGECGVFVNIFREVHFLGGRGFEYFGKLSRQIFDACRYRGSRLRVRESPEGEYVEGIWGEFTECARAIVAAARASPLTDT